MKRERRKKPTAAELRAAGVSRDLVVRRIPAPDKADAPGPNAPGPQGPEEEQHPIIPDRRPGPSESRAVRTGAEPKKEDVAGRRVESRPASLGPGGF